MKTNKNITEHLYDELTGSELEAIKKEWRVQSTAKVTRAPKMKHVNKFNWLETNKGGNAWLYTDELSVYNYKTFLSKEDPNAEYHNGFRMKIANILGSGGTVVLADKETKTKTYIKVNDEELVLNYKLMQLEYAMSKYKNITDQSLRDLGNECFMGTKHAKRFFESKEWAFWKTKNPKTNLLDLLLPVLAECEERKQLRVFSYAEQKRLATVWTDAAKIGIFRQDVLMDLPNQDVTRPVQPDIEASVRVGDTGPYASFTNRKYVSTSADTVEQRVVNAWYYNSEFRLPTIEEQQAELQELQLWFSIYQELIKVFYTDSTPYFTEEDLDKFARLQELEDKLAYVMD